MYKQSAFVLALFLGTSDATLNQFATGMNGDEDMGEDITMKGDKFHFTSMVQTEADPVYPAPEKVSTTDPKIAKAHTTFYNQNKSLVQLNPDVRTAFYAQYDKQNGLWRTGDELIATNSQDVPQIHPYNYNPWVYKFSRDAMGPHSQHIDDDPEDSRPRTKEELANTPEAIAKREAEAAEEKKTKDAKTAMKDDAEKTPDAATAAKVDAEALEKALKKGDATAELEKIEKKDEKKEEKKAELLQYQEQEHFNRFYNAQDGVWMYDPTLIQLQGEPENSVQSTQYEEFGPSEKVQNLMPRRYERSANSNFVDGVRVSRTTYYSQLQDDMNTQLNGDATPTEQVSILEPVAYNNKANTNLPFTRTTFY